MASKITASTLKVTLREEVKLLRKIIDEQREFLEKIREAANKWYKYE